MDERQLRYFVAVADGLSFTRAAEQLFAAQSTVSAGIRALERELGTRLLERSTARVRLTDAGMELLPRARAITTQLDAARTALADLGDELRGRLRLGTLSGLRVVGLPALVEDFHARHPRVALTLETSQTGSEGLLRRLRANEIDVAFVGLGPAASPALRVRRLASFSPGLLVPEGHPLAGRGPIPLIALTDEPFVDLAPGFTNRSLVDDAFRAAGLHRRIAVQVTDVTDIPAYVAAGVGVAIVPPLRSRRGHAVTEVPLEEPLPAWDLVVATGTDAPLTRPMRAFLDLVPTHTSPDSEY